MRLWHKELIPVLPKQQLISQWRECIAIARKILEFGEPHHRLVDKVMDYPMSHFYYYTDLVQLELISRGYNVSPLAMKKFEDTMRAIDPNYDDIVEYSDMFANWHTADYLLQCYYNLQEKADCGIINNYEWLIIERAIHDAYQNYV